MAKIGIFGGAQWGVKSAKIAIFGCFKVIRGDASPLALLTTLQKLQNRSQKCPKIGHFGL